MTLDNSWEQLDFVWILVVSLLHVSCINPHVSKFTAGRRFVLEIPLHSFQVFTSMLHSGSDLSLTMNWKSRLVYFFHVALVIDDLCPHDSSLQRASQNKTENANSKKTKFKNTIWSLSTKCLCHSTRFRAKREPSTILYIKYTIVNSSTP